jgi:hypothetical protein
MVVADLWPGCERTETCEALRVVKQLEGPNSRNANIRCPENIAGHRNVHQDTCASLLRRIGHTCLQLADW